MALRNITFEENVNYSRAWGKVRNLGLVAALLTGGIAGYFAYEDIKIQDHLSGLSEQMQAAARVNDTTLYNRDEAELGGFNPNTQTEDEEVVVFGGVVTVMSLGVGIGGELERRKYGGVVGRRIVRGLVRDIGYWHGQVERFGLDAVDPELVQDAPIEGLPDVPGLSS
jgi:hypothetical protein